MSRRFFFIDRESDVTDGDLFSDVLATNIVSAPSTQSVTVPNLETESGSYYTDQLVPSQRGRTSDYTIQLEITTGSSQIEVSPVLYRVNAGGTRVASFSDFAEQTGNVGTLTFTASSVDLGTFVNANRIEVEWQFRSTRTHGGDGETVLFAVNSPTSFLFAPNWGTRSVTTIVG